MTWSALQWNIPISTDFITTLNPPLYPLLPLGWDVPYTLFPRMGFACQVRPGFRTCTSCPIGIAAFNHSYPDLLMMSHIEDPYMLQVATLTPAISPDNAPPDIVPGSTAQAAPPVIQ